MGSRSRLIKDYNLYHVLPTPLNDIYRTKFGLDISVCNTEERNGLPILYNVMKILFVFLILFMSISINLPDSVIARVGIDANYLTAGLLAIVISGLLATRKLFLVVLVVSLCIGANMPETFMSSFGIDRDYLFATLIAIVILAFAADMWSTSR